MIFGKYGNMILNNLKSNYPHRLKELEITGQLEIKIFEREQYILKLKEEIEKRIIKENPKPKTKEVFVITKYQQMIEGLVDEELMKEVLEKI